MRGAIIVGALIFGLVLAMIVAPMLLGIVQLNTYDPSAASSIRAVIFFGTYAVCVFVPIYLAVKYTTPKRKMPPPIPAVVDDGYPPMPVFNNNQGTTHGTANWDHPAMIGVEDADTRHGNSKAALYIGGGYLGNLLKTQMHAVCVAGSGQGKGVCLILPNLLTNVYQSWFVLDPKGENALFTAKFQAMEGQKVVILDPWNEQERHGATHGIKASGFNPLDFVKGNRDEMAESCGVIAEMIVVDSQSKDPYWDSRARALVKTYLLHLITARPEEEQHLGTLYRWLRLPKFERETLWAEMRENLACDELVKSGIGEFISLDPNSGPLPSILSTAQDNTSFLESTQLRASLSKNEFDPYELTNGRTTVYLCLPERFLNSHARWLRIVVGVCLKACNYKPVERVTFLLDEFAILGRMVDVERAFAFARGQKISMWIFVQSLTQLIQIYGEHGANAFLANARLRQFFGIYDLATQKYLSEYLGETTVQQITKSESSTSGGSSGSSFGSSSGWSSGSGPNNFGSNNTGNSTGTSSGSNWSKSSTTNEQSMGRRLLTVEEIGKSRSIITLIDGRKYQIPRLPFWDDIYQAYADNRATFYPADKQDWHEFIDELRGLKRRVKGYNLSSRADGFPLNVPMRSITGEPIENP